MNCIEVVLYFLDLHSEIMRKGKPNIEEHNSFTRYNLQDLSKEIAKNFVGIFL